MPEGIIIRKMAEDEIPLVRDLIHHAIGRCFPVVYNETCINYFYRYHSEENILRRAQDGETYVLECDQQIVGTGNITGNTINALYVHSDNQHKGFGKALLHTLLQKAKQKGQRSIVLAATSNSLEFYIKMGWSIERKRYEKIDNNEELEYYDMILYI